MKQSSGTRELIVTGYNTETYKNNRTITVSGNNIETIKANRTLTVTGTNTVTVTEILQVIKQIWIKQYRIFKRNYYRKCS